MGIVLAAEKILQIKISLNQNSVNINKYLFFY